MGGTPVLEMLDRVRGDVVNAQSPAYDEARRVYNGMVDRHPLAVVPVGRPRRRSSTGASVTASAHR